MRSCVFLKAFGTDIFIRRHHLAPKQFAFVNTRRNFALGIHRKFLLRLNNGSCAGQNFWIGTWSWDKIEGSLPAFVKYCSINKTSKFWSVESGVPSLNPQPNQVEEFKDLRKIENNENVLSRPCSICRKVIIGRESYSRNYISFLLAMALKTRLQQFLSPFFHPNWLQ